MACRIRAVAHYLPENRLTNADLSSQFPVWPIEKIESKTGISQRRIASEDQCSSDLAVLAAEQLFASRGLDRNETDFILLCTQSPDYFLPTTACLVQDRLQLPQTVGALDFNLGCSGFVYGLSLADGLIAAGSAKRVLLITAETYSKFLHPADKSVRTLFGDGAAAVWVEQCPPESGMGPFLFGTNGAGGQHLIVPTGGMRNPRNEESAKPFTDGSGNIRTQDHLYMNGGEIFSFTLETVPAAVHGMLAKAGCQADDIDLYIFHQANAYMLEALRKQLRIPPERFFIHLRDCGNTVSSTIPIALEAAVDQGVLKSGMRVMLVGFGVGLSWAAAILRW